MNLQLKSSAVTVSTRSIIVLWDASRDVEPGPAMAKRFWFLSLPPVVTVNGSLMLVFLCYDRVKYQMLSILYYILYTIIQYLDNR